MERPPESLKPFANRIAAVAASENSSELVRLLRISGLLDLADKSTVGNNAADNIPDTQVNHDQVGIWERKIENGKACFVRRMDMINEWHFWANLGRIEAKGAKRRVILVGESVARGYLYDPEFTPAMALELILKAQFGEDEIEVIDLARTNLSYEVRELAIAALQLQPDVVIVFAGNNWGVSTPLFTEIGEIESALLTEGMIGAKRTSDAHIGRKARRVVTDIAAAYEAAGVPLIWIIPEFNLGDWRDTITNAPHLSEGLNEEWLRLLKEAQTALLENDLSKARKSAERIIEIDHGVCVAGLYILADCSCAANDLESERKYLEMARDAASWDSSMTIIPRPYSITQEVMREVLGQRKHQTVDLPALFKEYLKGGIPDRRLFLDYCHLTTEGIQIAMGAAASCVLRALKGTEIPWYSLVADHIVPPRETEAEASFLAAIHCAHRWQPYDVVRYFCARALSLSPHIVELMLNYIDLQAGQSIPMRMSESEEKIFKVGSPLMHHYLFRTNDKRMDRLLLDAIVETLEEVGIGSRERLERIRREEHSVTLGEVNLLNYYYLSAANQPQELAGLTWINHKGFLSHEPTYYRAFWPQSQFVFVGEADFPVRLSLACRLPKSAAGEEKISVQCNGKTQVEMTIGRQWTTWDIDLSGDVMCDGLNEITVHWPMPQFRSAEALQNVINNLCHWKFPDFYPIFGEIHSFTAACEPVGVAPVVTRVEQLHEVHVS